MALNDIGILGHGDEYRPRYGLWLNTSMECQNAVTGILAEGWDCLVVLKYRMRCSVHAEKYSFRPVLWLSQYREALDRDELNGYPVPGGCKNLPGCFVQEVFFPEALKLRRRELAV